MDAVVETDEIQEEPAEAQLKIDFKMVTFSLAGKDYGIDIMSVKEISKVTKFTFTPNTFPYVRGVYNLRGEIIPIIDMRKMFHLPVEEKPEGAEEDVIILRLADEMIIGIIVDSIDKVLGVSSETIQPPHPIFGDINIKYIDGVVENEGRLYIILDVDRIFSEDGTIPAQVSREAEVEEAAPAEAPAARKSEPPPKSKEAAKELKFKFVIDTLKTFISFHVTELNSKWTEERFKEWEKRRRSENKDVQLQGPEDAAEFLKSFYSPYTGSLWGDDYKDNLMKLLPEEIKETIHVWNPGCGRGFESYSITAILKMKYPRGRIKTWANDIDLLNISTAPNLIFTKDEIPDYFWDTDFIVKGPKGYRFADVIKDSIVFEYHDILNRNEYPEADVIVARGILSFFDPSVQHRLISEFREKLKENGLLIIGKNEILTAEGWYLLEEGNVTAYRKEK